MSPNAQHDDPQDDSMDLDKLSDASNEPLPPTSPRETTPRPDAILPQDSRPRGTHELLNCSSFNDPEDVKRNLLPASSGEPEWSAMEQAAKAEKQERLKQRTKEAAEKGRGSSGNEPELTPSDGTGTAPQRLTTPSGSPAPRPTTPSREGPLRDDEGRKTSSTNANQAPSSTSPSSVVLPRRSGPITRSQSKSK